MLQNLTLSRSLAASVVPSGEKATAETGLVPVPKLRTELSESCQTLRLLGPLLPEASKLPPGAKATASILLEWPVRDRTRAPLVTAQTLTAWSKRRPPEARRLPS